MSKTVLWVVFSLIYGSTVALGSYLVAWKTVGRDFAYNVYLEHNMKANVRAIQNALHDHFRRTSQMPNSADELGIGPARLEDAWGSPLQLDLQSSPGLIVSFGRDGKPGGDNHGADYKWPGDEDRRLDETLLSSAKLPSLRHFAVKMNTRRIAAMAIILGALGFVFALVMTLKHKTYSDNKRALIKSLCLAGIGLIWAASIIAQFFIPTGH